VNTLLLASTLAGLPPSEAVLMAFHQACNVGELRLSPSEVEVIDGTNSPTPGGIWDWGRPKRLTSLRLKYPRNTYIFIGEYEPKYAGQMARVCEVYSDQISYEDAERAFLSGVHKPTKNWPYRTRSSNRFEIDRPKDGYRKRLFLLDAGWVIMETGLYKAPH